MGLCVLAGVDSARAGPPPSPRVAVEDVFRAMDAPRADVALEADGAGRLRHRGDGFTAIIHPDGSVEFRDHGGKADASFLGFDLTRGRFKEPPPERHDPGWAAVVEHAIYPMGQVPLFGGIGGSFGGLADGPKKRRHTGAKRAFLAATEALRLRLAHAWYRARLQAQLAELGGELVAIWRDPKLSLAERKRRLVRRWEECEEPTSAAHSQFDAMRVAAGRTARAKIEAFVRQVAPLGSSQAYTAAELDRHNRGREGRARFRPYDESHSSQDAHAGIEIIDSPRELPPDGTGHDLAAAGPPDETLAPPPPAPEPGPPNSAPVGPAPAPGWLPPPRD